MTARTRPCHPTLEPNGLARLMNDLRLDSVEFARLVGVDFRTVTRWLERKATPSGAAAEVIFALARLVTVCGPEPTRLAALRERLSALVNHGGLRHMVITLLEPPSTTRPVNNEQSTSNPKDPWAEAEHALRLRARYDDGVLLNREGRTFTAEQLAAEVAGRSEIGRMIIETIVDSGLRILAKKA